LAASNTLAFLLTGSHLSMLLAWAPPPRGAGSSVLPGYRRSTSPSTESA